ncbi:hypothetical protein XHV734_4141 [Xanthomonas hortorum pv. vitians]|nr:hypothetical protein XHV734_4141 [Xanthomonas hortorum pv. vitians]
MAVAHRHRCADVGRFGRGTGQWSVAGHRPAGDYFDSVSESCWRCSVGWRAIKRCAAVGGEPVAAGDRGAQSVEGEFVRVSVSHGWSRRSAADHACAVLAARSHTGSCGNAGLVAASGRCGDSGRAASGVGDRHARRALHRRKRWRRHSDIYFAGGNAIGVARAAAIRLRSASNAVSLCRFASNWVIALSSFHPTFSHLHFYPVAERRAGDLLLGCGALALPPSRDTPQVRPCRLLRGIHAA